MAQERDGIAMTNKRLEHGGFLVMPAAMTGPAPGVVVVHENRGLNPSTENVARRVAKAGFVTLVPADLTSVVGYPPMMKRAANRNTRSIQPC